MVVQAVIGPIMCLASDTFQARKSLLVGSCLISMIGAAIAPGSKSIYRLIAAQTLIGFGFSGIPLTFVVPSEILPRRWRPSKLSSACCLRSTNTLTLFSGPSGSQYSLLHGSHQWPLNRRIVNRTERTSWVAQVLCMCIEIS